MDESSWNGTTGEVKDSSGNGVNGTASGGTTTGTGKFGNGASISSNQIVWSDSAGWTNLNTSATVSLWVNCTNTGEPIGFRGGYMSAIQWACNGDGYFADQDDNRLTLDYTGSNLTGAWHHVVMRKNGNTADLFIDGISVASITNTLFSTMSVYYGWVSYGSTYVGKLDELRIYNRALSSAEVTALYNYAPGPVGYWDFNENSGTTNVYDKSGNGYIGTMNGSMNQSDWVPGKFGSALEFDGNDDSISTNNTSQLTSWTISAYVNGSELPNGSKYSSIVMRNENYQINWDHQNASFRGAAALAVGGNWYAASFGELAPNTWYYLSATYDGETLKAYKDGVLTEENTNPSGNPDNSAAALGIGRDLTEQYFKGRIDEVKIYNYARSPSQILQDMNGERPISGSSIDSQVGYWKFDESNGDTANNVGYAGASLNDNLAGSCPGASTCPSWSTDGKFSNALSFDGSNDFTSISDSSTLDMTGQVSVSTWVNLSELPNEWLKLVGKWNDTGDQRSYNLGISDANKPVFTISADGINTICSAGDTRGAMVSTHVTDSNYDNVGTASVSTNSFTPPANSLLVVIVGMMGGDTSGDLGQPTISGGGLTYSFIGQARGESSWSIRNNAFYAQVGSNPTSMTITVDDNDNQFIWSYYITVMAYTGYDTSNPVAGFVTSNTTDIGDDGETQTLANAPSMQDNTLLSIFGDESPSSATALSSGWSAVWDPGQFYVADRSNSNNRSVVVTDVADSPWKSSMLSFIVKAAPSNVSALSTNTWYHLTGVFDGSTCKMSVNGTITDTKTSLGTTIYSSSANLIKGGSGGEPFGGTNKYLKGKLDETKLYSIALTSDQIKTELNQDNSSVMGALSTASDGTTPSNSTDRSFCVPGDTSTCNPPILYYKFDEKSGTTTYDASGNGNDGTLVTGINTYPLWQSGKFGSGLKFAGASDKGRINAGSKSSIDNLASNSFTFETWFKNSIMDNYPEFAIKGNGTAGWEVLANFQNANRIETGVYCDGGTNAYSLPADNPFLPMTDNKWHHLTFSYNNATDRKIKIYIDALEVAYNTQTACTGNVISDSNDDLLIGSYTTNSTTFAGLLDDVRIYNYVRTPAQVAWDYNNGGPVAWYQFDECQGSTAYDSAPNLTDNTTGNNGTVSIGATGSNTSAGTCTGASTEAWKNGANGKFNSSLSLDGIDDYIAVADPGTNSNFDLSSVGSHSVWIKFSSLPSEEAFFVTKGDASKNNYYSALCTVESCGTPNSLICGVWNGASGDELTYLFTPTLGRWYHIACTYDDPNNTINLFVDGKLIKSKTDATSDFSSAVNDGELRIGRERDFYGYYFNGQIDDVRVFNYTLTPLQVKSVMNNGSAVNFAPITGSP